MIAGTALVVILFMAVQIEAVVNPFGPTVILDYISCIDKLVENSFKEPAVLIFAGVHNASNIVSKIKIDLLTMINSKLKYKIEIINFQGNGVNVCEKYDEKLGIVHINSFGPQCLAEYFVVIVESYEEFSLLVSNLIKSHSWNPYATFIVLLFNYKYEVNTTFVESILSCLFKYNVINVVVIVPEPHNIRNSIIYGWRPYDPPKYCGYFNETAQDRIFIENRCEKGSIKYERSVFPDKLPSDMKSCALFIIALERQPFVSRDKTDANIEKVLINELAKRYNFETNYEIINAFRGERESSGLWNGALGELTRKKGQMLLGGIFPDFDIHEDFECSISYLADAYTWVVPRAYFAPPWLSLVVFQSSVWYSVIVGFLACALFWRMLGKLSGDTSRNTTMKHCFLNAWICSVGFCCYMRPTTQSLRIFFVFFNIYCILIVTGYQTKLIDELKNPARDFQIQTMEELIESGLKFGGFEELHGLFENSSDPFDNFMYENWIDVSDLSAALVDVAVNRNFSILCSRLELAHLSAALPELSDDDGEYKYFAFELNIFSVPMEMIALRGFSFMGKFSRLLRLYKESGISEGVRRRYAAFNARRRGTLLQSLILEKSDINSLSLQHLQGGFMILLLGYVSGTSALAFEIIIETAFVKEKWSRFKNNVAEWSKK